MARNYAPFAAGDDQRVNFSVRGSHLSVPASSCISGCGIITADHDGRDAGGPAFQDRFDDVGAQEFGKANEAQELEVDLARRGRPVRAGVSGMRNAQPA